MQTVGSLRFALFHRDAHDRATVFLRGLMNRAIWPPVSGQDFGRRSARPFAGPGLWLGQVSPSSAEVHMTRSAVAWSLPPPEPRIDQTEPPVLQSDDVALGMTWVLRLGSTASSGHKGTGPDRPAQQPGYHRHHPRPDVHHLRPFHIRSHDAIFVATGVTKPP